MKFIGKFVSLFDAIFKKDVTLDGVETGTIASGGNLGLDSNNKIVKNTVSSGTTDLTSDVTGVLPIANGGTNSNSAANARTALGVDAAGTDNSTNVTLTGTPDYITISGQEITRNQIDLANDVTGTLAAGNVATLNQDTTGTATNATKQIVVTTHNFQLNNSTSNINYVPFNNLNESVSGGGMNNYWTRTLAPYPGTIKKIAVRSHTSLGNNCTLRISKITDTTDKLEDGTHVDNTSVDLSTAQTTVVTTMNTNSFAAGNAVGVAIQRSTGVAAQVVLTIVWEYTT